MGRSALWCLALVASVLVVFQPAFGAGFVNWDDNLIVTGNPHYRGLSGSHLRWMLTSLYGGHWEPLTWLSLALDHRFHGMEPRGYHATNVALHAGCAVLVFALVRVLFPALGRGGAGIAAAFFALHPLRVESVAWVTERRDVLSALLFLATTLLWARATRGGRWPWLAASYAAFALALMAKAAGLAWPLVFLVVDVLAERPREVGMRRVVLEKVPYVALAVAAVLPALEALDRFGATEMAGALDPGQRAAQALYGLYFYPAHTLVPVGLSPLYLLDLRLSPLEPRYLGAALAVVAVTATLVALRRRLRVGLAAWLCYGALILPFLGLSSNGIHLVADRYSYVGCLPFAVLVGGGAALGLRAAPLRTAAVALLVLAGLGAGTFRQTRVWNDSLSLWNRAVEVEPENYVALNKRGLTRLELRDREGAIADFSAAVTARPKYASAYLNRGIAQVSSAPGAALADFDRAIELRAKDPAAFTNRGALRIQRGDYAGAVEDLTEALRLAPGVPTTLLNRGLAHLSLSNGRAALADFEGALRAAPPSWPYRQMVEEKAIQARAMM
ncbi:MAG: hypothetical protein AAF682_02790 [Planctomycetota bacterium]